MHSRATAWAMLAGPLDLLVIGGGITGAGVLLEAARRGLRAGLVERGDFASGTSSRSSKLVHGGLRYLREGKIRLTRESVRERETLLREAPGLVDPMPFLMPQYRGRKPGRTLTQAGLWLYDALAGTQRHGFLSAEETLAREPAIAAEGLEGAHLFYDAATDDARLVLRLLAQAERYGGFALNYAEASALEGGERGRIRGAAVRNVVNGETRHVNAAVIVNAGGVFADAIRAQIAQAPRLRPLRGSHLLVAHDRLPVGSAVAFAHPADGRPVFAYPWMQRTLVGTTDLDHGGDPNVEPAISPEESRYLLDALHAQFPQARIEARDVVSTFAGVRPVVASGKARPSSESRDHLLLEERGVVTITGGKLTTFRPMALAALAAAARLLRKPLDFSPARIFDESRATASMRLNGRYGQHASEVLDLARAGETAPIADTETTWAELRYALHAECVEHLDDLLLRRTRLGLQLADGGAAILPRVRQLCAQERHWDDARWNDEAARYAEMVRAHYAVPA